jgi:hypothetical protein
MIHYYRELLHELSKKQIDNMFHIDHVEQCYSNALFTGE